MHAAALADVLDVPEVLIPPIPGGFSALGLVTTDLRRDYSKTYYTTIADAQLTAIESRFSEMEAAGRAMLTHSGIPAARQVLERSADCRYVKQAYELTVPFPPGGMDEAALDALADAFHSRHAQVYGHQNRGETVQIVNVRLSATGRLPELPFTAELGEVAGEARRTVWFPDAGETDCLITSRAALAAVGGAQGPLIVEEVDTTVVVPPGWRADIDERGFISLKRGDDR